MKEQNSKAMDDRRTSAERDLDGSSNAEVENSQEAIEDLTDEAEESSDLDILVALAELDAEAAQAYRIGAAGVEDPAIRTKLEEFARDHERHVDAINALLEQAHSPEVSLELDEGSSSITMLAAAAAAMGDRIILLTLIGNEQLTNSAYPNAMELPFEEEVMRMFERHRADEQRHLDWLVAEERNVRESGLDTGPEA